MMPLSSSLSMSTSSSSSGRQPFNSQMPNMRSSLPGGATLTPGVMTQRNSSNSNSYGSQKSNFNLTITPSVTITPTSAPPVSNKMRNVS